MTTQQRAIRGTKLILIASALWLGVLGAGQAVAGGLLLYEVGTADVGLASAGWGVSTEYAYGGTLDVDKQSTAPVSAGGRGDLVGSYPDAGIFFLAFNFNWVF